MTLHTEQNTLQPKRELSNTDSIEVTLRCPPETKDFLEEILWTIEGVTTIMEEYENPNQPQTTLTDLKSVKVFGQSANLPELIEGKLAEFDELAACKIIQIKTLEEADWATEWQKYWDVTHITENLTIIPSWKEYSAKNQDEVLLNLDPGCAFGTGTHGTTQLMLKQLEALLNEIDFSKISILDVGTGSGILAIYAAKLGCQNIKGVEIDKKALEQAKQNAKANDIDRFIEFSNSTLEDLCMTPYNIVLANIIAPVIKDLWEDMMLRLEAGGKILISGLVEKNVPEIQALIEQSNLTLTEKIQQGEWVLLIAEKN